MGFLDNSGDIILDAVLTDYGRELLAKGDGSFQIGKFALGDEEIDYSLYDKNNPSGSSYYDLQILQTPILEAFTDNAASMKSQLLTYENLELLFLPVLRLNDKLSTQERASDGVFYVTANRNTTDNNGNPDTFTGVGVKPTGGARPGFLFGEELTGNSIRVDQGLDTTEISPKATLADDLTEFSYTVQMDNRLLRLADLNGTLASSDYVDDDNIAFYTLDMEDPFIEDITVDIPDPNQVITGPRGTKVQFKLQTSMDVQTSAYLFNTLGGSTTLDNMSDPAAKSNCLYIDTNVRLTGIKTGAFIDLPIRIVRLA